MGAIIENVDRMWGSLRESERQILCQIEQLCGSCFLLKKRLYRLLREVP
jgi:hypothetical protein